MHGVGIVMGLTYWVRPEQQLKDSFVPSAGQNTVCSQEPDDQESIDKEGMPSCHFIQLRAVGLKMARKSCMP
jgi:hypothetical protein